MGKIIISNKKVLDLVVKILIVGKVRKSEIKKIKNSNRIIEENKLISIEVIKENINSTLLKKIKVTSVEDKKEFLTGFINGSKIDINFYLGIVYAEFLNLLSYKEKSSYPFYDGETIGIFSRSKVYNLFENRRIKKKIEIIKYNYKSYYDKFRENNSDRIFYWEMTIRKEIQRDNNITFHQVMNELIGRNGFCYRDSRGLIRRTKSRSFFYKYRFNIIFNILKKESREKRDKTLEKFRY